MMQDSDVLQKMLTYSLEIFKNLFIFVSISAEMSKCYPPPSKRLSKYAPMIHVMKVCQLQLSTFAILVIEGSNSHFSDNTGKRE